MKYISYSDFALLCKNIVEHMMVVKDVQLQVGETLREWTHKLYFHWMSNIVQTEVTLIHCNGKILDVDTGCLFHPYLLACLHSHFSFIMDIVNSNHQVDRPS